jgi:pyrroloquinoline-quinone synthase
MDLTSELTKIVKHWSLLKHPFYEAWTSGKLSVEALQVYAREYGAFIETLPEGWSTLNDDETAQEEKEHIEMWEAFTRDIGTKSGLPELIETIALARTARQLFARPATALGALYAFEVQQPETALSKLDGLNKWYDLSDIGKVYFKIHSANEHESRKILDLINALSEDDQREALDACSEMSEALWNGLTGIQTITCKN